MRPWPLHSTSYPIHYTLIIKSFNALYFVLLIASMHKP
jgi:hypothetical protein